MVVLCILNWSIASKEEFGDIVSVNVYPEPEKCASQGYCLNSKIKSSVARSNIPHNIEAEEIKIFRNPQLAVGIDIGMRILVSPSTKKGNKPKFEFDIRVDLLKATLFLF